MLRVRCLSGEEVACLPIAELSVVKNLKRHLHSLLGVPRFRQYLLCNGRPLHDDFMFDLAADVQLVLLSFPDTLQEHADDLAWAAASGSTVSVSAILHRPQNPNMNSTNNGMPPLLMAACSGHLEVVQLLLEAEARIDATDNEGNTALICAAYRRHFDMVQLLLQAGSSTNVANVYGETALICASVRGNTGIARLLVEAGSHTDHANMHGETALCRAAGRGHLEVVRLLLAAGADREKVSRAGMRAAQAARGRAKLAFFRLTKKTRCRKKNELRFRALFVCVHGWA